MCGAMLGCPALGSRVRQQAPKSLQQAQAVALDVLMVQGQGMQEGLQVVACQQLCADQTMLSQFRVRGSRKQAVQGQATRLLIAASGSCKQPG